MRGSAATAPAPRRAPERDRDRRSARRPVRGAPRRADARRPRIRWGLLLVPLIAAMLAGIVWVNVAKLTVTTQTGEVLEQARAVQAETVGLQGRLEQRDGEVIDRARVRLGMVPAPSDQVTYLDVPRPAGR